MGLEIRQADVIAPAFGVGDDRVSATIVAAVDQQPARAGLAHFLQGDFLLAHATSFAATPASFNAAAELVDLEDARDRHIRTLIDVRATSAVGLQAKANAMLERRCYEDGDALPRLAVSLARDVARPRSQESVEGLYRLAANSGEDVEVVEAGRKPEALIPRYADAWIEWAKLHRQARAVVYEKYGNDYGSPAWSEPLPGTSPATAMLSAEIERNGTDAASQRSSALHDEIEKLADSIRSIPIEGPTALRAKALVAIFDCWPLEASAKTFSFGDEGSHWSLFDALLSVTGLYDLFFSIEDRLETATA